VGLELLIAGLLTITAAALQHFTTTVAISTLIALIGVVFLLIPRQLKRNPEIASKAIAWLESRYGQIFPLIIPTVLSAFLFILTPQLKTLQTLGILLVCFWIIGVEVLLFYRANNNHSTVDKKDTQTQLAVLNLLLAYGILLTPSKIPSLLDGIPWDTPIEFIFATLLLPFAFLTGRRFLNKKIITIILGLLFIIKLALTFFLPQSGLGVRAYSSEEALQSGNWEKSYGSLLTPSYTQVTQLPYRTFREFPIEWINRNGFDADNFWLALELAGVARLQENERLVFIVEGARQAQLEMIDAESKSAIPIIIVKSANELDARLYREIPYVQKFELRGLLVFQNFGQYRLEPVILYPDGSARSALSRIWTSSNGFDFPLMAFQYALNFIAIALMGIILASLIAGIFVLYRTAQLGAVDLYLAITGFSVFYIADISSKPNINILFLFFIGVLACIKITDILTAPHAYSGMRCLFSIGMPLLWMFLALDINNLQSVAIFPQEQDCLEYQILARNIFVNGDIFLAKTPPFAYKVLFPYLAGLLHIFFGQSASSLLFLNIWCALLSSVLILKLSDSFELPARISLPVSISFLLILCLPSNYIYYFRFGLIEPVAILCLLATFYFAINRQIPGMFWAGILTALLRLNFLGAILTAVILTSNPITGTIRIAWKHFFDWIGSHWKLMATYLLSVVTPSLLIMLGYSLFIPNYITSASINNQTSLGSISQSLLIVIFGGDPANLYAKLLANPVDILLISIPVSLGFLIALASLFFRKGPFKKIDLRLSLLILSILAIYIVFQPIGYFPRYSWSPLPMALIIIGLFLHGLFYKNEQSA
jgi:hypothetical protein